MLKGLDEISRLLELKDPTIRAILVDYTREEGQRMDTAVYRTLEKKYPSLTGIVDEMRKGYDPIEKSEETMSLVGKIKQMSGYIGLLLEMEENPTTKKYMKAMSDKANPACDLYDKLEPIQQQFYLETAKAIKAVASERKISPEQVVANQDYMDEVTRMVFPTRQEAERYLELSQRAAKELFGLSRGLIAIVAKYVGGELPPQLQSIPNPNDKAVDALQKAVLEYRTKEFDRVYARKR